MTRSDMSLGTWPSPSTSKPGILPFLSDKGDFCPKERPLVRDCAEVVDASHNIWTAVHLERRMLKRRPEREL